MYPEDRVLVAYIPKPADFDIVRQQGWYRIPEAHAPKGLHAEYYAFYFGRAFGPKKWAIHYYARQRGHELMRRVELLPEAPEHPRAEHYYYKVALGPLRALEEPIVSLRLRRVSFLHTTWDRFMDAREINDLFLEGGEFVDRLYATLKERGLRPVRNYRVVEEKGDDYTVPLALLCQDGRVEVGERQLPRSDAEVLNLAEQIVREVAVRGGERA
ncbi:MAG: hypothetical protein R3300_07825 [Candidatus Promineifilaceae bacterium]|nr:hypothetical protein [Candidatus Promineifilaceae bacterium]